MIIGKKQKLKLGFYAPKWSLGDGNLLTKMQRARVSSVKNYRRERERVPTMTMVDRS